MTMFRTSACGEVPHAGQADPAAVSDPPGDRRQPCWPAEGRRRLGRAGLGWLGDLHACLGGEGEPVGRRPVADALVGPGGVVVRHPGVQGGLGLLDRVEGVQLEELAAHGLVQPLDLAGGGRRVRRRQQMADAVVVADPVKQHRPGPWAEPGGEYFAVVGEDRLWYPVAGPAGVSRITRNRVRHQPKLCPASGEATTSRITRSRTTRTGRRRCQFCCQTGDAPHSREEVRGEVPGELGGGGGI